MNQAARCILELGKEKKERAIIGRNAQKRVAATHSWQHNVNNITQLDAAFYTNHHFAMLTLAWGKDMKFNGCIVSRNESIVYGTSHLILNYDYRLMGGGQSHGFYLPRTWDPVAIVYWAAR